MSQQLALESIRQAKQTNARRLNLSGLKLTELPPEIGELTELRALWLAGNRLETLPPEIGRLTKLQSLRLEDNRLTALPPEIGKLAELRRITLHKNRLAEFPEEFWDLYKLQGLITAGNRVEKLPYGIGRLTNLRVLKFGGWYPKWGQFLGNKLSELPSAIAQLQNLQTLYLSSNQLTELPPAIAQLQNLQRLWLNSNQLTELPPAIAQLQNLTTVNLDGNPWASLSPEVVQQGWSSVRQHLLEASKQFWVSKMLVVGQGGVGKTSLLRRLRNERFDPNSETTHGMERGELKLEHPQHDVDMNLVTWDFGGQEIYHATHQFFLTRRSLYIVAWNAREGHDQGKLDYWLDKLKALADDSPVILVATHTENYTPNVRLAELQEKHPNLITDGDNVFCVSNETGKGIVELREAIRQAAAKLPLMGERWPIKWRDAADAILANAKSERHVSATKWKRLLAERGITGVAEQTLSVWLHELGEILYFRDDDEVDDTVILDPQWVTEVISRVVTCKQTKDNNAILTKKRMRELWHDVDLEHDTLLRFMEKFDLSYRTLEDKDKSLIVELLPEDEDKNYEQPWEELGKKGNISEISMKYELDLTMPAGIPTWFIARQHRFTKNIHWRHGVLFRDDKDEKHLGLVRSYPSDRQIRLIVRGPAPHYFFDVLRSGLELTLNRFKRMGCKRLIPCKGHNGAPCAEEFELEDLLGFVADAEPQIQCRKSRKMVSVSDLLVGIRPENTLAKLDEILSEVKGTRSAVAELTALVQQNFTREFNAEQSREFSACPNIFALRSGGGDGDLIGLLEPIRSAGMMDKIREKIWRQTLELQLYCQQPGHWHPVGYERGKNDPATELYQIEVNSEALQKLGPYLLKLAKMMKYVTPLTGYVIPGLSSVQEEQYQKRFKEGVDLWGKLADAASKDGLDLLPESSSSKFGRSLESRFAREVAGYELRGLRKLLEDKDKSGVWGKLRRRMTPEGNWLWLCEEHWKTYTV
ncbi:MAG: COR domain-containing protein [Acidobacteriota bacterium]|nr:COR domain-containing protein [Acidobacteriota bacterium]